MNSRPTDPNIVFFSPEVYKDLTWLHYIISDRILAPFAMFHLRHPHILNGITENTHRNVTMNARTVNVLLLMLEQEIVIVFYTFKSEGETSNLINSKYDIFLMGSFIVQDNRL